MWRLLGIQGAYSGRFFDLTKDRLIIGSDAACDISLGEDDCVAESHAELVLCNGNYVFRDLNTGCPSTLNGQVVSAMTALNDGDTVQIGDSVFRLEQMLSGAQAKAGDYATTDAPGPSTRDKGNAVAFAHSPSSSGTTRYVNGTRNGVFVAIVAVLVLLAGMGIVANRSVQAKRAVQERVRMAEQQRHENKVKMATDAILSLKAIGSALTVGINEGGYSEKVVYAQTKIDAYVSECGEAGFDRLATKLRSALELYADAGSIWNYKISTNFSFGPLNPLWSMCRDKYPQVYDSTDIGGARRHGEGGIDCDLAMQILWAKAGTKAELLKLPDTME